MARKIMARKTWRTECRLIAPANHARGRFGAIGRD
jgi:hypothetical protein